MTMENPTVITYFLLFANPKPFLLLNLRLTACYAVIISFRCDTYCTPYPRWKEGCLFLPSFSRFLSWWLCLPCSLDARVRRVPWNVACETFQMQLTWHASRHVNLYVNQCVFTVNQSKHKDAPCHSWFKRTGSTCWLFLDLQLLGTLFAAFWISVLKNGCGIAMQRKMFTLPKQVVMTIKEHHILI